MKIIDRKFLNVPTPTCHAATIAFFKDKLAFAYFGGVSEGAPDSTIYIGYDGEIKHTIGGNVAHWNPILFTIEDELFLSYKIGDFCDRWCGYILNITDIDNIDKSKAQIIPAGLNFCVKTKPIVDSNGLMHCGSSVETRLDWTSYEEVYKYEKGKFVFVERSMPLTIPKKKCIALNRYTGEKIETYSQGIIQPSLWQDEYGSFHAFFRSSRGIGKIYYASKDISSWCDDWEWTKPVPTILPNPNSGIDTVYYKNKLFLVYNPSNINRYPLVLSEIKGVDKTVDELIITEDISSKERTHSKELSYPYMIENGGKLHLVYTYGRSKIEYVIISI
ncbi:hypothetical protein D4R86_03895 [bacterium]|nr:MAG: hypothetical protein D4R86_03895 [bacterium]